MSRRKDVVLIPKQPTDLLAVESAFLSRRNEYRAVAPPLPLNCAFNYSATVARSYRSREREGPSLVITYAAIAYAIRILRRSSVNGERGVVLAISDKRVSRARVFQEILSLYKRTLYVYTLDIYKGLTRKIN